MLTEVVPVKTGRADTFLLVTTVTRVLVALLPPLRRGTLMVAQLTPRRRTSCTAPWHPATVTLQSRPSSTAEVPTYVLQQGRLAPQWAVVPGRANGWTMTARLTRFVLPLLRAQPRWFPQALVPVLPGRVVAT